MAPFASQAQMRWMYATHPRMAKRWTKEQEKTKGKGSFKRLPEKKKKRKKRTRDDFTLFEILVPINDNIGDEYEET